MKLKVLLSSILILTLSIIPVMGEEFDLDLDTSVVTINGQIPSGKANQIVTIQVLQQVDENTEIERYIYQTATDGDGKYAFQFKMISPTGFYTYYIKEGTEIVSDSFYFSNPQDLVRLIEDINNAIRSENSQELESVCEANKELLGIELPAHELPEDTSKIYEYIVKNYDSIDNTSIIQTAYKEGAVLQRINEAEDSGEITTIIQNNPQVVGLTTCSAYPAYEALVDDGYGNLVMDKLLNKSFENFDVLREVFNDASILTTVYKKSWVSINSLITANNEILQIDLDEYNRYSDKVDRKVAGRIYSSITEFVKDIKDIIAEEKHGNGYTPNQKNNGPKVSRNYTVSNNVIANQENNNTQVPKQEDAGIRFNDIGAYEWAKDSILFLANKGAVSGKAEGIFAPDDRVTREEYVKMLLLAFDIKPDTNASCNFDDVHINEWYYPYISKAYEIGLINGKGNVFGIGETITRQDMAVIAYRLAEMKGFKSEKAEISFADAEQISEYARKSIGIMSANGILNGMDNNLLKPLNSATRAEAAKVIHKLFVLVMEGVQ